MIVLTTVVPNKSRDLLINGKDFLGDTFYNTQAKVTKFANKNSDMCVVVLFDKKDTNTYAYKAFKRYAHVEINL